jgi:hypothetical protein
MLLLSSSPIAWAQRDVPGGKSKGDAAHFIDAVEAFELRPFLPFNIVRKEQHSWLV